MGTAGTAHGRFSHAIARGNLLAAESAARELGGLALEDALNLCVLLAEQDPRRYRRAAVRWLARLLAEREIELEEASLAAAALGALPHRGARQAASVLTELARRPRPTRPLAISARTP